MAPTWLSVKVELLTDRWLWIDPEGSDEGFRVG